MLEGYWRPMTLNDAVQIAQWHDPPPYDFYDADRDDDDLQELLEATTWPPDSYWVREGPGRVMGFVTFDVTPNGGWIGVAAGDGSPVPISVEQAALWEPGEWHAAGTTRGLTAVVLESDDPIDIKGV